MKNKIHGSILLVVFAYLMLACTSKPAAAQEEKKKYDTIVVDFTEKVDKSDAEWKGILTDEEYRILRNSGTDRPFTGDLWNNKKSGIYVCGGCGLVLFDSNTKFKSGTGWPSFYEPINEANVGKKTDDSHGMKRTEVICNRCNGHLGHVFPDGPEPTGLRYCINTAALDFVEKSE